ncbi:hypothetical protein EV426DRAFT_623306 [Tirmania nivea]|nr:hypothetical protein EV426DRAFT_623306 [Tirmania nivea]
MPARRCQSYNKNGDQCGLTTKTGDFCWRHVLNPKPISAPVAPAAPAPRPTVRANVSRAPITVSQNSSGNASELNHGISVSENVAPAVVITAKVEGSEPAPSLYQIREIGRDEPRPLQRARTWRDLMSRPLRTSVSSNRWSDVNIHSNQVQPENIIRGMGFSPKTRRALLAYLNKTREIQEDLYIACSPKNSAGERRVKIGRTADSDRRKRDYKKCDMKIVWSMGMDHTTRLEKLVLMGIKLEFTELGRRSGNTFVREIRVLGRKVVCPCGKSHNDMFLTTGNWDNSHMDELKNLVFEFSKLDRIESENLFKLEADEEPDGLAADREESEQSQHGAEEEEGPAPVRATSEERIAEIYAELVRAQRSWVRGADGRLIRTT